MILQKRKFRAVAATLANNRRLSVGALWEIPLFNVFAALAQRQSKCRWF